MTDIEKLEELKREAAVEFTRRIDEPSGKNVDEIAAEVFDEKLTEAFDLGQMLEAEKHNQPEV